MPSPRLTPGSIQSSDVAAICTPGWAEAHRDVSSETKDQVAAEYSLPSRYGYEIDHLIPLELGGSNAVSNLWPEPYGSPFGAHQKDGLEDYLHDQVCYHGLALDTAQHEIATNWYATWSASGKPMGFTGTTAPAPTAPAVTSPPPGSPPPGSPSCSVSASYNAGYHDYDVYVRSNRPDQAVTVTASGGASRTWRTDGTGYADVYLGLAGNAAGQQLTAHVGGASCSTTIG
ncbi:MAG: HNH endonuclease signature motif containing protein [Acidimicrobiales bacterium]